MASPHERATAARVLRDAGHRTDEIADLLHVSESQVYRYLNDTPSEPQLSHSAVVDLEALLAEQELDGHGRFNAGVAMRLAQRLDQVANSTKAQDALAMPQIAKELRAVVGDILDVSADDRAWLADVFAKVGHATDPGAKDPSPAGGGPS